MENMKNCKIQIKKIILNKTFVTFLWLTGDKMSFDSLGQRSVQHNIIYQLLALPCKMWVTCASDEFMGVSYYGSL